MSKRYNYLKAWALCMALVLPLACSDDEAEPLPVPVADFTSAVDAANPLKVTFTNTSKDATSYSWDFGDGSAASTEISPSHTYTAAGEYNVKLTATSAGGSHEKSAKVTVTAAIVDVIEGGDTSDEEAWTIEGAGAPTATEVAFTDGKLVFSNGTASTQSNIKVWQAVEVEAGTYTFSAKIKGGGATNSWVEIIFGTTEPVADQDYTTNIYTGLNTWDGCGGSEFDANLATFGCKAGAPGTGANGEVSFANDGTVYVILKAGSWDGNLGAEGVTIDDLKLIKND